MEYHRRRGFVGFAVHIAAYTEGLPPLNSTVPCLVEGGFSC